VLYGGYAGAKSYRRARLGPWAVGDTDVMQIAVLHPGEMGAAVGRALTDAGHEVSWLPAGRGPATQSRARTAGLDERQAVHGCDVVLSICPPSAAVATARSVSGFTGLYVDANAISPTTAEEVMRVVTAGGAGYVDGGIIGPPPASAGTTRLYLSGARADELVSLFTGTRVDARRVDGGPFAASSLKMAYAAWSKISAALVLSVRASAAELGVEAALLEEWAHSQPQLAELWAAALSSGQRKGWRWEDEMRQIAQTFTSAGQPAGFGVAAAEVFGSFPRPTD
jgi:3-hydroxyisobutyrate dehydrogenase-like beta-hydroxyacid dehydrogenase